MIIEHNPLEYSTSRLIHFHLLTENYHLLLLFNKIKMKCGVSPCHSCCSKNYVYTI